MPHTAMWSEDGFEVAMGPTMWRGAGQAIREAAARVPCHRLVRVVHDPLPKPPAPVPVPTPIAP